MATVRRDDKGRLLSAGHAGDLVEPFPTSAPIREFVDHWGVSREAQQAMQRVLSGGELYSSREEVLETRQTATEVRLRQQAAQFKLRHYEYVMGRGRLWCRAKCDELEMMFPRLRIRVEIEIDASIDATYVRFKAWVIKDLNRIIQPTIEERIPFRDTPPNEFPGIELMAKLALIG